MITSHFVPKFYVIFALLIFAINISLYVCDKNTQESSPSSRSEDKDIETSTIIDQEDKKEEEKETNGVSEASKDDDENKNKNEEPKDTEDKSNEEEKSNENNKEENTAETATGLETSVSEDQEESVSSGLPMLVTVATNDKESNPEGFFAVLNSKGHICIFAKFSADIAIKYPSTEGERKLHLTVPEDAIAKGRCESATHPPILHITWLNYVLTFYFNKTDTDNSVVTSSEFSYDTSSSLFDHATDVGKVVAKTKSLSLFETPLNKSYFCPAQEVILLYDGDKQVVTARLKDIYLQAYNVENGQFSPTHRCAKVIIDGLDIPFVQDETVPLAVGCTLALITLIILIGFSVHRAYTAAKADYNAVP